MEAILAVFAVVIMGLLTAVVRLIRDNARLEERDRIKGELADIFSKFMTGITSKLKKK